MSFNQQYLALLRVWKALPTVAKVRRPRILHHYTTTTGFQGIISTGTLFLSDAMFLNDQSELIYSRDVLADALQARVRDEQDNFWKAVWEIAANLFLSGEPHTFTRFFVASFCTSGNLLSQWRAYAAPGSGYALGFRAASIDRASIILNEKLDTQLHAVIYKRDRQLALVNHLLDGCKQECTASMPHSVDKFREQVLWAVQFVTVALTVLLPRFKHPVFSEEKEWRLSVLTVGDQAQPYLAFRASGRHLIPYLALDLTATTKAARLPLASVTHAPVEEPELRKRVTRDLLHGYGYSDKFVKILGSNIPLRLT